MVALGVFSMIRNWTPCLMFPTGFKSDDFTNTGSYLWVDDGNGNYRIKFLSSGVFTPRKRIVIDAFLVGGGAGSGYTATQRAPTVAIVSDSVNFFFPPLTSLWNVFALRQHPLARNVVFCCFERFLVRNVRICPHIARGDQVLNLRQNRI